MTQTPETLQSRLDFLQSKYRELPYLSFVDRKSVLIKLKKSLIAHEQAIYTALKQDYGFRSEFDTFMGDLLPTLLEINYTLKNLKKWMKPAKRHAGFVLSPSKLKVMYQPLGVVGIIVPWNFPIFLAMGPAIQALAAGNRVMIKLSEFTPRTNEVLIKIFEPLQDHATVIQGDHGTGALFSSLPFDHLVFTGSTAVGKLVAKAAAENLTPVTLELGGKSPVIIDKSANINNAIDAIIMGKVINSGQICVSPDYIFVPQKQLETFVETFKRRVAKLVKHDLSHIINEKQFNRLQTYLEDAESKGAKIHTLDVTSVDVDSRFMPFKLLTNINESMSILQEEIFGPLIPILTYNKLEEVISFINQRPKPLALYIMSQDKKVNEWILKNTHSGGVCINDTIMHVMAEDAPFGGVGHSGIGQYHGYEGFLTFSKARTILSSPARLPKNKIVMKYNALAFKILHKCYWR